MTAPLSLPAPPRGRRGWPWDVDGNPGPVAGGDSGPLPRITVITPSLDQGPFIEETIRSVVGQGWPDLQYIVVDGGSTDGTLRVLRTYEPWLASWVSAPDGGQADAINKGLRRATGDLVTWFSADDVYAPGAFAAVAAAWRRNPRAVYAGAVVNFREGGWGTLFRPRNLTVQSLLQFWSGRARWHDPGLFWSRAVIETMGETDASLHYAFDYDYLLRAVQQFPVETIDRVVAGFRVHGRAKTAVGTERMRAETASVSRRHWPRLAAADRAGLADAEFDLRIWEGCDRLRRGQREGLAVLGRLCAERPSRVALQLSRLARVTLRRRLARLGPFPGGAFR